MNELSTLPPYDANRFYRRIAELTEKYFEISENKKKFEEWKKQKGVKKNELKYQL